MLNSEHDNKVSIVFIADDNFAMPTAVAITSIITNKASDTKYEIFVLSNGISPENKDAILSLNSPDARVIILEADETLIADLGQSTASDKTCTSRASLFKFFIPDIFPGLDRVLYLDGDVIVEKDLSEFFNMDISDVYAAIVKDMLAIYGQGDRYTRRIGAYGDLYFNNGVMLLNLDLMRKNNIVQRLVKYRKDDINFTRDQDVFNFVFGGNVHYVDFKYNLTYANFSKFTFKHLKDFYQFTYETRDESISEAVVLHFGDRKKPWMSRGSYDSEIWDAYFQKSPFNEKELKRKTVYKKYYPINKIENAFVVVFGNRLGRISVKTIGWYGNIKNRYYDFKNSR